MQIIYKRYALIFLISFSITILATENVRPVFSAPSSSSATVIIGEVQDTPPPGDVSNPSFDCDGQKAILAPNATRKLLTGAGKTNQCFDVTAVVMHYSAQQSSPLDNDPTYNTLIERGLSCVFGTDDTPNKNGLVEQWLELFESKKENEYCTGTTEYNNHGISIEMAGNSFDGTDGAKNGPSDQQYQATLDLVCFLTKQYKIPNEIASGNSRDNPKNQILGHHELGVGKPDPGPQFLDKFRQDLWAKCPNPYTE